MPRNLTCTNCGKTYEAQADEPWRCTCGNPLDFETQPQPSQSRDSINATQGLWAFGEFLPMESRVTLGEGWTPIVDAPNWDAQFKLEYVMPSGSFKDRGATAMLSRAVELGVERVVDDSSGNAGAAIAQYAARAGIEADIFVPAKVKKSKLKAIKRVGANPVLIEGSRKDVTDACIASVEEGDAWYASHAWNPAFFAGTMTFSFELAAQRDWSVPDVVVLPLGHGTLYLGAYRGFDALKNAGWIDEVPQLLGVQAAGAAPIAESLHDEITEGTNDVADGIQITDPVRKSQILEAVDETGGDVIAIGEKETENALDALHRSGFYVEPTSSIAVAALDAYRKRGELNNAEDVVVPLTGSGLKY